MNLDMTLKFKYRYIFNILTNIEFNKKSLTSFGYQYHLSSIYKLLNRLGFSWITSHSKHPKQSIEAQEDFKKIPNKNDL